MSEKVKPLKTGSIDAQMVKDKIEYPKRKGKYKWEDVEKTLKEGKAYVFSSDAMKNSVLTGLRRLGLLDNADLVTHKDTGQLIVIPKA